MKKKVRKIITKQYEFIMRAFWETRVPVVLREYDKETQIDAFFKGYCTQYLSNGKHIVFLSDVTSLLEEEIEYIEKYLKIVFGEQREELLMYYRLITLVGVVLTKCYKSS